MALVILALSVIPCILFGACEDVVNHTEPSINHTQPDQDMYVIHATVYQVGILTNRTDNMTDHFNSTGHQESVTLYSTNGSNVDLGAIPEPILTNVTAQSMIGVAPVSRADGKPAWGTWHELKNPTVESLGNVNAPVPDEGKSNRKRSLDNFILRLFKRDTGVTPVRVVNGAAVIPPEAGLQSISLPPLLSLNNNMSEIPVPIPNTSVVHYAKINTLIRKP